MNIFFKNSENLLFQKEKGNNCKCQNEHVRPKINSVKKHPNGGKNGSKNKPVYTNNRKVQRFNCVNPEKFPD
jgi:hypothetical protein